MNKISRLKKLVGKEIWVQTAGSSSQGTLLALNESREVMGEIHLRPGNFAYSDIFIYIEHIEQIMVLKKRGGIS